MKLYVVSVIIIGVIGSIIRLLSPVGEGGGLKNHVKLAIGIAIIPICIFPLTSFIEEMRNFDAGQIVGEAEKDKWQEYESIFNEEYLFAEEDNLREGIASILEDRFGIERSDSYVSVKFSRDTDGTRKLERIFINLYGAAIWKDTGEIESYLSSILNCQVVIAVG